MPLRTPIAAALLVLALVAGPGAVAEEPEAGPASCHALGAVPVCIREAHFVADVCHAIETYAGHWRLPVGFFARLIWQESRFDPQALSHAGAEGIAQFMPATARLRGLRNSFDPAEALARSAEYLRLLRDRFGNFGLAAAAYNAGEARLGRWIRGGSYLPAETRDYVRRITGEEAEAWLADEPPAVRFALRLDMPFRPACEAMARHTPPVRLGPAPGEWHPWGVMLAQDFSADVARRRFERVRAEHAALLGAEQLMMGSGRNPRFGTRLRHFAMIGRESREAAQELCTRLTEAGAACLVRKN